MTCFNYIFQALSLDFIVPQYIFLSTAIYCSTVTGEKKIYTERRFSCSTIIYGDEFHLLSTIYDTVWLSQFLWFHRDLHVATHARSVLYETVPKISYRNNSLTMAETLRYVDLEIVSLTEEGGMGKISVGVFNRYSRKHWKLSGVTALP